MILLVVSSTAQAGWFLLDSESCVIERIMGQKVEQAGTDNKVEQAGTDQKVEQAGTDGKVEQAGRDEKQAFCKKARMGVLPF